MNEARRSWLAGAMGVALALLPYARVLADSTQALLYRDLSNVAVPYKAAWAAGVRELGRVPHWSPLHAGGSRFLADMSYGPLYPLNPLFLPFSETPRVLTFFIALHHALIFLGWYLCLRGLRVRVSLAVLGGLAMAWCGPAMSADCLLHHLGAQAAVGFFFHFWRGALAENARGRDAKLFAASFALAWPIYAGDVQYAYLLSAAATLLALVRGRAALKRLALLGALTFLAAAPQLLSTLDSLRTGARLLDGQSDANRLAWSLHPLRLLELPFPLPFGDAPSSFRASSLLGGLPEPFVFSQYAGAFASLFAGIGLSLRRRRRTARARAAALVFLLVLLLTLGSFTPLYALFLKIVPLWSAFRYPERLGYWVVLGVELSAVLTAEKLLRLRRAPARAFAGAALLLPAGAALAFWLAGTGLPVTSVAHGLAFAAAFLLALRLPRQARGPALLALAALDLAPVAGRLVWPSPVSLTRASSYPWAGKILEREAGREAPEAARFFSAVSRRLSPPAELGGVSGSVYSAWAGMKFNTPAYWGIPLARGHSSLAPDRPVLRLISEASLARRALELLSVRYLLETDGGIPAASLIPEALPEAFGPAQTETFGETRALLQRLASPAWAPSRSALVETSLALPGSGAPLKVTAFVRRWDELRISLQAQAAAPARWFLVSEAYDPLWRATVDGAEAPVARANGWATAVALPALAAGSEVELALRFRDSGYRIGLVLLGAWALLLVTLSRRRAGAPRG